MAPDVDAALRTIMMTLLTEIGPQIGGDYPKASVQMIAVASLFMADEYDRAAELRVWENDAMRRLLRDHADKVVDRDLQQRLRDAAQGQDESLRISALRAGNAELKRRLIELQAALEEISGAAARDALRDIVAFLREAAGRRTLKLM